MKMSDKILRATMFLVLVNCFTLASILSACGSTDSIKGSIESYIAEEQKAEEQNSIVCIYRHGDDNIYQHKQTGVCYYYHLGPNGGGLTVMLNADGTPYTGR